MKPIFAMIGRVNEGKSSIIATLVRDDGIAISPVPGTTTHCASYSLLLDGRSFLEVVDTPGFQQPEAVLQWLIANHRGEIPDRPATLAAFVREHEKRGEYTDEVELLRPILAGATILYVADGSHPWRPSFAAEFEILRWTGLPRMALINRIGDNDHTQEWRVAMGQYFNLIHEFNAHAAFHSERVELFRALRVLRPDLGSVIDEAMVLMDRGESRRLEQVSDALVAFLVDALTLREEAKSPGSLQEEEKVRTQLEERFRASLNSIEATFRHSVDRAFSFRHLESRSSPFAAGISSGDILSQEVWHFLGLSTTQLVTTAAMTGAATGGIIDVGVGGSSFLVGTFIGGVVGAASAAWLARGGPEKSVVGVEIAGNRLLAGPIRAGNFPWIVLDRALIYYGAVATRTHAVRTPLDLLNAEGSKRGVVSSFSALQRRRFQKIFSRLMRSSRMSEGERRTLKALLVEVLAHPR